MDLVVLCHREGGCPSRWWEKHFHLLLRQPRCLTRGGLAGDRGASWPQQLVEGTPPLLRRRREALVVLGLLVLLLVLLVVVVLLALLVLVLILMLVLIMLRWWW